MKKENISPGNYLIDADRMYDFHRAGERRETQR